MFLSFLVQYFKEESFAIELVDYPTHSWTGFGRENAVYFWLYKKDPFVSSPTHSKVSIYTGTQGYRIYISGQEPSGLSGFNLLGEFYACVEDW